MILRNMSEVNIERTRIAAESRVHDTTRQNDLIPIGLSRSFLFRDPRRIFKGKPCHEN